MTFTKSDLTKRKKVVGNVCYPCLSQLQLGCFFQIDTDQILGIQKVQSHIFV